MTIQTTPRTAEILAEAMRRAMSTIRAWEDGIRSASEAHRILYEALENAGFDPDKADE